MIKKMVPPPWGCHSSKTLIHEATLSPNILTPTVPAGVNLGIFRRYATGYVRIRCLYVSKKAYWGFGGGRKSPNLGMGGGG